MDYDKLNGYLVQLLDGVELIQTANNKVLMIKITEKTSSRLFFFKIIHHRNRHSFCYNLKKTEGKFNADVACSTQYSPTNCADETKKIIFSLPFGENREAQMELFKGDHPTHALPFHACQV